MENGFAVADLIEFLDMTAQKGLIKPNTVNAQKAACNQVLGVLEGEETKDLRKVDIGSAFQRYINLNPTSLSPDSLKTYRSRVEKAVGNFLTYRNDKENWKPRIQERTSHRKKTNGSQETKPPSINYNTKTLSFPYPIREDVTVTISNVPRDLNKVEAKRLAVFIEAIAVDSSMGNTEKPN